MPLWSRIGTFANALGAAASALAAEPAAPPADGRQAERERMVAEQIEARGVREPRLLAALRKVPRHLFVPAERADEAYADRALAIGHGATISQPYVVAVMTEEAAVGPGERVLEVGTGSGYQAALLAELGAEVYTIEIVEPLAHEAEANLRRAGHPGVHVRAGDGYRGWPEAAPFDAILVTAAAPRVPEPLLDQLAPGGRLVIPVDVEDGAQELQVHERTPEGITVRRVLGVRFVPMTGEVRDPG
ncbi:MAG: protein-L-isoaspartate(D-aspartate) O-methyltransferase [Deltaproteobacteria bacterium]|nr:protein-L-isoaspartate(D-aspartate) O-methyltransferase [Deltaproteobacteria bacterium]